MPGDRPAMNDGVPARQADIDLFRAIRNSLALAARDHGLEFSEADSF